jgi:cell division protease FtsH
MFIVITNVIAFKSHLNFKMVDTDIIKYKNYLNKESFSDLYKNINEGKVSDIYISKDYSEIISKDTLLDDTLDGIINYHLTPVNPFVISKVVDKSVENKVNTVFLEESFNSNFFTPINDFFTGSLTFVGPFFLFVILRNLFIYFTRGQNPMPPMPPMPFGFNKKNNVKEDLKNSNITLSSWTGSPEIFEECTEIVSYLKNNTLYKNIGAEIPKGILLEGPPGTGKTLLAKAIASECDAYFIPVAASEFVEIFVGMGATRVRSLFKEARENKPCIIFIDEIDAVGRQRGAGINMANDEREQTLNQLLAEMDGFGQNDGLLVMAATNRKDVLDKALLRPGRFDRILKVPLPDKDSRKKILELYLNSKKTDSNIDLENLAEITTGFSGADLKNIINEAAIIAVRETKNYINEKHMLESFEKSVVGIIKRNDTRSEATLHRVSIHEAGHAFLAAYFKEYFILNKISIQSTYNGAGGYTIFNEKPEITNGGLYTKDLLIKRLIITLGGKAAEQIFYGDDFVSVGATQDLKEANSLAQKMIGIYGMGDKLEVFYNENIENDLNPFLGRSISSGSKFSDKRKFDLDKESLQLVINAYNEAKQILKENKNKLMLLIDLLEEKKILKGTDLINIL